jgi:hypothetical protein
MYTINYEDIVKGFPSTITPPPELRKLVEWANANEHKMGGYFELYADDGKCLEYWSQNRYLNNNFAQFGVGPSGAPTGIWRNDDGVEKIVYLYDEEMFGFVVADSFLDWMRILAIGYEDTNHSCNQTIQEYNKAMEREDLNEGFNPAFKVWVENEFNTTVPLTGDEVAKREEHSFNNWIIKAIKRTAKEHIKEYPLFAEIGKDIRESWLYAGLFFSEPLIKEGDYLVTEKNLYGIKVFANENYIIQHLQLGANEPSLYPYRNENPYALESANTRADVINAVGENFEKGTEQDCEFYLYKIESNWGIRKLKIYFNPDKAQDNIWKYIIK